MICSQVDRSKCPVEGDKSGEGASFIKSSQDCTFREHDQPDFGHRRRHKDDQSSDTRVWAPVESSHRASGFENAKEILKCKKLIDPQQSKCSTHRKLRRYKQTSVEEGKCSSLRQARATSVHESDRRDAAWQIQTNSRRHDKMSPTALTSDMCPKMDQSKARLSYRSRSYLRGSSLAVLIALCCLSHELFVSKRDLSERHSIIPRLSLLTGVDASLIIGDSAIEIQEIDDGASPQQQQQSVTSSASAQQDSGQSGQSMQPAEPLASLTGSRDQSYQSSPSQLDGTKDGGSRGRPLVAGPLPPLAGKGTAEDITDGDKKSRANHDYEISDNGPANSLDGVLSAKNADDKEANDKGIIGKVVDFELTPAGGHNKAKIKKKKKKKKKSEEEMHKKWAKKKKSEKKAMEKKHKESMKKKKEEGKKGKKKWGKEEHGMKKKGKFKKKKWGKKVKKGKGVKKGKKGKKFLKDKGHKNTGFKTVYHKEEWGKSSKWHDIKRQKKWDEKSKKWKKKWKKEKGKKYKGDHMKKFEKKKKEGKKYKKENKDKFKKFKKEEYKKGKKKKMEEHGKKKEGGMKKEMKEMKKKKKKKKG